MEEIIDDLKDEVGEAEIDFQNGMAIANRRLEKKYPHYLNRYERERNMDKHQSFAVGHYLSDWPECWTYEQVIDCMMNVEAEDEDEYITIHSHYEDFTHYTVGEMIQSMNAYTRLHFGEINE